MSGDLSRSSFLRRALVDRRTRRRGVALALGATLLVAGPLRAADDPAAAEAAIPGPALRGLGEVRRWSACLAAPTDDFGRELEFRGRPALEIKGRERGGAGGALLDRAIYDLAIGRIASYVCFGNASTRASGEAIYSLADISGRADKLARVILPDADLQLESIQRYRTGGTESVYYEARYATVAGEFPFLEPPVRLLLNATTGSLFRMDFDPDWLDPAAPPRTRISRKAAELIATVVLRAHDLTPAFGAGAVFGKVAAAELFTVHPNDWLDLFKEGHAARARLAWVVPFRVEGGAAAGLHSLFVDAATGTILGGLPGQTAGYPPR